MTEILTYGTIDPYLLFWMSEMEEKGIQWDKNMEDEFIQFVVGMIMFCLRNGLKRSLLWE